MITFFQDDLFFYQDDHGGDADDDLVDDGVQRKREEVNCWQSLQIHLLSAISNVTIHQSSYDDNGYNEGIAHTIDQKKKTIVWTKPQSDTYAPTIVLTI